MVSFTSLHPIPYETELDQLANTYRRALSDDVAPFASWIREHAHLPMLSIGSGGSSAAAEVAAYLHGALTGQLSKAGRQMDLYQLRSNATNTAGLYVTAGGSHSDSVHSCRSLGRSAVDWAVFAGTVHAPGPVAASSMGAPVFEYDLLPDVHGWVAVNSLLAQVVVLVRAYGEAYPHEVGDLPPSFAELLPDRHATIESFVSELAQELKEVLSPQKMMLLHSAETRPSAVDLDSKFAEAGLGEICVSDLRDFAHGRYQSILSPKIPSSILALCTAETARLTRAMLDLVPEEIPHTVLEIHANGLGARQVAGVVLVLALAGAIGRVHGRAPGWGSSDTFGDLMYEMNPLDYLA